MDTLSLAYLAIGLGLLLLVGELFFPTGGVLFVLAAVAVVGGCLFAFMAGDTATGMMTLVGVFVGLPLTGLLIFTLWPYSPLARRGLSAGDSDDTLAAMPVNLELERYRGRFGRAVSDLRPAGVVDFDGKRIDTLTEGRLVPAGAWVKCIDVRAGRVLVRPCDPPTLDTLEDAAFDP